ncbi:hypothetical protein D0Z03_002356 [Geotrichum reessii]|nr:hypothetical protein D0Z03_002356 [Galactomyces reessii]
MSGRQGGKLKRCFKALKQAKKKDNNYEDEEDAAFKAKQKADAQARKEMASKASKGGPLVGGGIKKYVNSLSKCIVFQLTNLLIYFRSGKK